MCGVRDPGALTLHQLETYLVRVMPLVRKVTLNGADSDRWTAWKRAADKSLEIVNPLDEP